MRCVNAAKGADALAACSRLNSVWGLPLWVMRSIKEGREMSGFPKKGKTRAHHYHGRLAGQKSGHASQWIAPARIGHARLVVAHAGCGCELPLGIS